MKLTLRRFLLVATVGTFALGSVLSSNAVAGQPHMYNALTALRNARHQLEMARADKGGHREAAIHIIDNAISEVQAGIDAGE